MTTLVSYSVARSESSVSASEDASEALAAANASLESRLADAERRLAAYRHAREARLLVKSSETLTEENPALAIPGRIRAELRDARDEAVTLRDRVSQLEFQLGEERATRDARETLARRVLEDHRGAARHVAALADANLAGLRHAAAEAAADAARELAAEERSHRDTRTQFAVALASAHDALRREIARVDEVTFDAWRAKKEAATVRALEEQARRRHEHAAEDARVAARRQARDDVFATVREMGRQNHILDADAAATSWAPWRVAWETREVGRALADARGDAAMYARRLHQLRVQPVADGVARVVVA